MRNLYVLAYMIGLMVWILVLGWHHHHLLVLLLFLMMLLLPHLLLLILLLRHYLLLYLTCILAERRRVDTFGLAEILLRRKRIGIFFHDLTQLLTPLVR